MMRNIFIQRNARCLLMAAALLLNAQFSMLNSAYGQGMLSRMEIGVTGGTMSYIGDLNNQSMFGRQSLAYGGFFRYMPDNRWSFTASGAYGHVEAGNPKGLEGVKGDCLAWRNLSFLSPIGEGSLRAEFNFFPLGSGLGAKKWSPYLFCGLGFFVFNPTARIADPMTGELNWYDLQPLGTEGQGLPDYPDRRKYTLIQPMMPFGMGLRIKPADLFAMSIEYGFRKTWTDYIDDCSLTYVGSEVLDRYHNHDITSSLADRSATPNASGIKRGDDSLNDWYAYLNITLSFRLDKMLWWVGKKKCDNKNY